MMIASHAGVDQGDAYLFVDEDVEAGVAYRYLLQIVNLDGGAETSAGVEVTLTPLRLFTPMIVRN